MKIACITYLHGSGGAERQIIMLANTLSRFKHEVHLIVLDGKVMECFNQVMSVKQ